MEWEMAMARDVVGMRPVSVELHGANAASWSSAWVCCFAVSMRCSVDFHTGRRATKMFINRPALGWFGAVPCVG